MIRGRTLDHSRKSWTTRSWLLTATWWVRAAYECFCYLSKLFCAFHVRSGFDGFGNWYGILRYQAAFDISNYCAGQVRSLMMFLHHSKISPARTSRAGGKRFKAKMIYDDVLERRKRTRPISSKAPPTK